MRIVLSYCNQKANGSVNMSALWRISVVYMFVCLLLGFLGILSNTYHVVMQLINQLIIDRNNSQLEYQLIILYLYNYAVLVVKIDIVGVHWRATLTSICIPNELLIGAVGFLFLFCEGTRKTCPWFCHWKLIESLFPHVSHMFFSQNMCFHCVLVFVGVSHCLPVLSSEWYSILSYPFRTVFLYLLLTICRQELAAVSGACPTKTLKGRIKHQNRNIKMSQALQEGSSVQNQTVRWFHPWILH